MGVSKGQEELDDTAQRQQRHHLHDVQVLARKHAVFSALTSGPLTFAIPAILFRAATRDQRDQPRHRAGVFCLLAACQACTWNVFGPIYPAVYLAYPSWTPHY